MLGPIEGISAPIGPLFILIDLETGIPSTMLNWIEDEDVRSIVADQFRLSFHWTEDRWRHTIGFETGTDLAPIIFSQEAGSDSSTSPLLSPALQELHVQQDPGESGTIQALLVGKSGAHHFSAVFSVKEAPGRVVVAVEIADRCQASQDRASSTYLVDLPAGNLLDAGPSSICWERPAEAVSTLSLTCTAPTRLDLKQFGRRGAHVQASSAEADHASTRLWNYTWSFRRDS